MTSFHTQKNVYLVLTVLLVLTEAIRWVIPHQEQLDKETHILFHIVSAFIAVLSGIAWWYWNLSWRKEVNQVKVSAVRPSSRS